jgi:hypothetical protein
MHHFSPRSFLSLPQCLLLPLLLPLPSLADSQAPAVTPAAVLPKLVARQDTAGITSCAGFDNFINSCSAVIPNIVSVPFTSAASCFCYSSGSYAPDSYDSAWANCVSYYQTADPAFYSSLASDGIVDTQPCKGITATAATGSSGPDPNKSACSSWYALQSSCSAAAPGEFQTNTNGLPNLLSEASCLCYTTQANVLVYAPAVFDGVWGSCVEYFKTASPSFYSASLVESAPESAVVSLCAEVGNVRGASVTITSGQSSGAQLSSIAPTPTGPLTTTVAPTGAKTGGAGRAVNSRGLLGISFGFLMIAIGVSL